MTDRVTETEGRPSLPAQIHGQKVVDLEKLVHSVARRVRNRFALRVELDDLIQLGMIGLLEAAERYDPESGVLLSSFAYTRIRGAILDGVGDLTGVKRSQLRRLKRQAAANEYVESMDHANSYGGDAVDIAGMVQGVLFACDLSDAMVARNDAEEGPSPLKSTPEKSLARTQMADLVNSVVDELPENEAELLRAHYAEGRSLQSLGDELGASRSWMSRIHKRALGRARDILETRHGVTPEDLSNANFP